MVLDLRELIDKLSKRGSPGVVGCDVFRRLIGDKKPEDAASASTGIDHV